MDDPSAKTAASEIAMIAAPDDVPALAPPRSAS